MENQELVTKGDDLIATQAQTIDNLRQRILELEGGARDPGPPPPPGEEGVGVVQNGPLEVGRVCRPSLSDHLPTTPLPKAILGVRREPRTGT